MTTLPFILAFGLIQAELPGGKDRPLGLAIVAADLPKVRKLLKEGLRPEPRWLQVPARGVRGTVAAREEILRLLLATKPDMSEAGDVLVVAVRHGTTPMVRELLEYGMDATYYNGFSTPFYLAIQTQRPDIVKLFLKHGASPTKACMQIGTRWATFPVNAAGYHGCLGCLKALLDSGASIQFQNQRGESALHSAVLGKQSASFVRKLLELGANRKQRTKDGETALDIAKRKKLRDVVKLLSGS